MTNKCVANIIKKKLCTFVKDTTAGQTGFIKGSCYKQKPMAKYSHFYFYFLYIPQVEHNYEPPSAKGYSDIV